MRISAPMVCNNCLQNRACGKLIEMERVGCYLYFCYDCLEKMVETATDDIKKQIEES